MSIDLFLFKLLARRFVDSRVAIGLFRLLDWGCVRMIGGKVSHVASLFVHEFPLLYPETRMPVTLNLPWVFLA